MFAGDATAAILSELLAGNAQNAAVFRDSGGTKLAFSLIPIPECRDFALTLAQQIVLASGSEDDFTMLLELLQTSPKTDLAIRLDVLKTIITCLKESHRCRVAFRLECLLVVRVLSLC
jgi:hypothetical protein